MKILLIRCLFNYYENKDNSTVVHEVSPPIGLMYVASYIRKQFGDTINVELLDLTIEKLDESVLSRYNPDICGLGGYSISSPIVSTAAKLIKEFNSRITVVAGGPYISADYEKALLDENIDYGVIGEGEEAFASIIQAIKRKDFLDIENIDGIAHRQYGNGNINVLNKPMKRIDKLDELPFPAYDLTKQDEYAKIPGRPKVKRKEAVLVSSRGCPYLCIYCHNIMGNVTRMRSAQNLFDEVRWLHDDYGINDFTVLDDIFNLKHSRALEFYNKISRSNMKINIYHQTGYRADITSEELIDAAYDAGVVMINFALESAVPRVQEIIKKNLNIEKFDKIVRYTCEKNIMVGVFAMVGLPSETYKEALETIRYLQRLDKLTIVHLFFAKYHPGTEMYDIGVEMGFCMKEIEEQIKFCYATTTASTSTISSEQFQILKGIFIKDVLFNKARLIHAEKVLQSHYSETEIDEFYSTIFAKKITNHRNYLNIG